MRKRVYQPGDVVRIGRALYVIERQVLFNQPAYRVRPFKVRKGQEKLSFVVDGVWIRRREDPLKHMLSRVKPRQKLLAR